MSGFEYGDKGISNFASYGIRYHNEEHLHKRNDEFIHSNASYKDLKLWHKALIVLGLLYIIYGFVTIAIF